jgi:hypothetical protein
MPNTGATVARLRKTLAPYFAGVELDTYFRRLREAGVIEAGKPGRNGAGSAILTSRDAAFVLIALCTGVDPISAAAEAARVGGFKLRSRAKWLPETGRWFDYFVSLPTPPTLLDFVAQSIEACRGALPEGPTLTFVVGPGYDQAAVQVPLKQGGGMLMFSPDEPGTPRPAVVTARGLGGTVIAEVAALFGPVEQQEIPPALTEWFSAAIGLPSNRLEAAHG